MMDINSFPPGTHTLSFTPIAQHGETTLYAGSGRCDAKVLMSVPVIGWAVVLHIEEGDMPFTSIEPVFFYQGDAYAQSEAASSGLYMRNITF
ncbi:hypothetical protein [Streptomyces sp. NPDC058466]|uniref:hypothetical protein n=1 Tax=Streptomyces sp. NPDC058466 TaxID=3346512 RepID=UPI00364BCA9C